MADEFFCKGCLKFKKIELLDTNIKHYACCISCSKRAVQYTKGRDRKKPKIKCGIDYLIPKDD